MTFAAIPWLSISINLLLVVFVIICVFMTLIILMQRPKQDGLGAAFGGGVTDQVFGARTTNVLQRGTVYLGSMFFIISLILSILIGAQNRTISAVKKEDLAPKPAAVVAPPKPLSEQLPPADPVPVETPAPAEVPADGSQPAAPVETPAPAVETPATPVETPAEPAPAQPAPAETPAPVEDKPQEH